MFRGERRAHAFSMKHERDPKKPQTNTYTPLCIRAPRSYGPLRRVVHAESGETERPVVAAWPIAASYALALECGDISRIDPIR
jgi:hypothetical protein